THIATGRTRRTARRRAMQAHRRATWSGFGLSWMLANLIAFTVGVTLAGALIRTREQSYFGAVTSAADAARIVAVNTGVPAAIFGSLLGTAQWLVLRRALTGARWWAPTTTLGYAAGGAFSGAFSGALGGAVSGVGPDLGMTGFLVATAVGILVVGLVPSALQWLVVRRQVPHAGWWVAASGGGLIVGLGGGLALVRWGLVDVLHWLQPEDFPSARAWVALGVISGLLYAAVTLATLMRLLRSRLQPLTTA